MSALVLDCSVTMNWCFEDESSAYAESVLRAVASRGAVVPALWLLEVGNVVLVGERRARLPQEDGGRFLNLLRALPVEIDPAPTLAVLGEVLDLARSTRLSAYDAAYLELARRRSLPLATLDDRLRTGAVNVGLQVI